MPQFIAPGEESNFVQLSRREKGQQGTLFRKQLFSKGPLHHPAVGTMEIDDKFFESIMKNFDADVAPIVQIPVVNDNNQHVEDPFRNIGEVLSLEIEDDKLYAVMDIREHADKVGKTLLGTSAMFAPNYVDTRDGKEVGPTLLHAAITNRPHLTNLDNFKQLVTLSAEGQDETTVLLSAATETENEMPATKDELLAALKADFSIDVAALLAENATLKNKNVETETKLSSALNGVVKLSTEAGQSIKVDDLLAGVNKIKDENIALSGMVQEMRTEAAKAVALSVVDKHIAQGFFTPAKKDKLVELCMKDREMYDSLVPEAPVVKLSVEAGSSDEDAPVAEANAALVDKYTALAALNK